MKMTVEVTRETYESRLRKLQELLRDNQFFAALIQQPRDLYYYAGTAQPANLWVPSEGEPILFTRRAHEMTREATWIRDLVPANSYQELLSHLQSRNLAPGDGDVLGFEEDVLPGNMVRSLQKYFRGVVLKSVSPLILRQRFVKDESEIAQIKLAIELWKKGHEEILKTLIPGKREYEVAAAMEYGVRKHGGDGTVWFRRWDARLPGGGIIAAGSNGWVVSGHAMTVTGVGMSQGLPWGASDKRLEQGDLVVADYGVTCLSYHCDMARTYCVGKPTPEQQDLWDRLVELHLHTIEGIKPGVTGEEIFLRALEYAKKLNMEENFMGVGKSRGTYIGHSIGLELDEWPVLGLGMKEPLPPGGVVTIEPKFMVPGRGGVMIEDDILITENGHEILSDLERTLFYV